MKVIERIHYKEEIYNGEYLEEAPDIIYTTTKEFQSVFMISDEGTMEQIENPNGNHKLDGIFLSYGSEIREGHNIKGAKIYDIVPTILHLMNLPIPEHMDGKVLTEVFRDESEVKEREISYEKTTEKDKISMMVRSLKTKKKI
jgi:predicted AlkP superfamily phosphohydrolase/phosphomutase